VYTFTPPLCGYCFPARGYLCYTDINVQVGHAGCTYHSPGAVFASQAGAFKGCVKDFHNLRTEASGSGSAGSAAEKFWITFGEGYLPATADVEPVVWPGINRSSRRRSYEMLCKNSEIMLPSARRPSNRCFPRFSKHRPGRVPGGGECGEMQIGSRRMRVCW